MSWLLSPMMPLAVASPAISLVHTLEVDVDGRHYRVILRGGEAIAVAVRVIEEFGPRTPHAYWRRVWTAGHRAPGRLVRVVIAEAKDRAGDAGSAACE
jgi:hypothetical protein